MLVLLLVMASRFLAGETCFLEIANMSFWKAGFGDNRDGELELELEFEFDIFPPILGLRFKGLKTNKLIWTEPFSGVKL